MAVFYRCDSCRTEKNSKSALWTLMLPQVDRHERVGHYDRSQTRQVEVCDECAQRVYDAFRAPMTTPQPAVKGLEGV